jgi:predicted metalloprotease with PDZ domain
LLEPVEPVHPWIGLTAAVQGGQLLAQRVQRGGPAERAGLMVGDELLGLDGQRLREPDQLRGALRAGAMQDLLISRRAQLRSLTVCSQAPRPEMFRLTPDPAAPAEVLERQQRWMALLPHHDRQLAGAVRC